MVPAPPCRVSFRPLQPSSAGAGAEQEALPQPEPEPEEEEEEVSLDELEVRVGTAECELIVAQEELTRLVQDDQGKLTVEVREAKELKSFEMVGKMDPYTKLTLGSEIVPEGVTSTSRTAPCKGGHRTPTWNQSFNFDVTEVSTEQRVLAHWQRQTHKKAEAADHDDDDDLTARKGQKERTMTSLDSGRHTGTPRPAPSPPSLMTCLSHGLPPSLVTSLVTRDLPPAALPLLSCAMPWSGDEPPAAGPV